jgi:hypothetical protein
MGGRPLYSYKQLLHIGLQLPHVQDFLFAYIVEYNAGGFHIREDAEDNNRQSGYRETKYSEFAVIIQWQFMKNTRDQTAL